MSFINNQVIADSVKKEIVDGLLFSNLGATVDNKDLAAIGAGNSIRIPHIDLIGGTLQTLVRGEAITTSSLNQGSTVVTIEQYAKGIEIFDQDTQYSIGGGELEDEAVRQLTEVYKHGIDNIVLDYILTQSTSTAIAGAANSSALLEKLVEAYGEKAFDGYVEAVVLHPSKVAALLADTTFVRADTAGYIKTKGSAEIGKLFGQIPVLMSNKIKANTADVTKRDNLVIVKEGVVTAYGKDFNVEQVRDAERKANVFFADFFFGVGAVANENKIFTF